LSPTRLRLEALEDRSNPSTLDPLAGAVTEPPCGDGGSTGVATIVAADGGDSDGTIAMSGHIKVKKLTSG
jgi:hypothetical protein